MSEGETRHEGIFLSSSLYFSVLYVHRFLEVNDDGSLPTGFDVAFFNEKPFLESLRNVMRIRQVHTSINNFKAIGYRGVMYDEVRRCFTSLSTVFACLKDTVYHFISTF